MPHPGRKPPPRRTPNQQLTRGLNRRASVRGAIGRGGGPGAANRQTLKRGKRARGTLH